MTLGKKSSRKKSTPLAPDEPQSRRPPFVSESGDVIAFDVDHVAPPPRGFVTAMAELLLADLLRNPPRADDD